MENRIKRIIQEEIDRVMTEKKFKEDFDYLVPFEYMGHAKKGDKEEWSFAIDHKGNSMFAKISKDNGSWYFLIDYDHKLSAAEAKVEWGPFYSYDEFKRQINNNLYNNLQFSTGNLKNGKLDAENEDLIFRMKKMMEKGDEILALKDGNLEDLKHLYKLAKKYEGLSNKDFVMQMRDEYHSIKGISLILSKVEQVDYYKKLEKYQEI